MTPEQHNKYLAFAHLAYASVILLFTLGFLGLFGAMFFVTANSSDKFGPQGPPPAIFFIVWLFFAAMYAAFTIPSFIAGYALLKRKPWAKVASIIGGVIAAMFFPIGTAVCVYTFWFLFSEPGKLLYDTPSNPVPALPLFENSGQSVNRTEGQQHSSSTPPDWR